MARPRIHVQPVGFGKPIEKAAAELARYLPRIADVTVVTRPPLAGVPAACDARIIIGTSEHLDDQGLGRLPEPHDVDDALAIIPQHGQLFLVGSNPRSALYATYRLLEHLGVVFLRPGPAGDAMPRRRARLSLPTKAVRETASYRHRGICIEGSPRLEHVLDTLDWMAKRKMNSFQLQFMHAGTFWRRGYADTEAEGGGSELDASMRARKLSEADCFALDDRVIAHMQGLGMVLHRVGHGWTAAALGHSGGIGWARASQDEVSASAAKRALMAEVAGRRALFHGMPINTELCYSNPRAREALYDVALAYARQHSEVDCLHIWLSDAPNNFCECQACRRRPPIDWYVLLLNEIGRRMTTESPRMRLVFLAYHDLLWPPVEEKLEVDNAILMFAPISRCFHHPLADARCDDGASHPRPELNQVDQPTRNRPFADLARSWKAAPPPDTFLFDYHMWIAVWSDGFGYDLGEVMARDMRALRDLGLNGLISCQNVRAFYPLPYLASAMAEVLWNRDVSLAAHRRRVMSAAFGKRAEAVEKCFAKLIRLFRVRGAYSHQDVLRPLCPEHRGRLGKLQAFAAERAGEFAKAARAERDPAVKLSLELFAMHLDNTAVCARIGLAGLAGDAGQVAKLQALFESKQPALLRKYSHWIDPLMHYPVSRVAEEGRRFASRRS